MKLSNLSLLCLLLVAAGCLKIGYEVHPPFVYTLPDQTYHHDLVAGHNEKILKPDVKTPVYTWRVKSGIQTYDPSKVFCMVTRPDLKNKIDYEGPTQTNQSISLVLPVKEHKRIYALTTNGTFIKYHNQHGKINKESSIKVNVKTNTSSLLFRGTKGNVYLLTQGQLYQADIQNDTLKLNPILKVPHQPLKAIEYDSQLLLLYPDQVHIWPMKNLTDTTKKHVVSLSLHGSDFIDMSGSHTDIFILSKKGGIAVLSLLDYGLAFYSVKVDGQFTKIIAYDQTIQVLYEYLKHNYVAELFFSPQLAEMNVNRIYRVMFDVRDMVMFEGVGILLSDRLLYYVEHSINRNSLEFEFEDVMYRERVAGGHKIAAYSKNQYVLVFHDHIKVVSIKHLSRTPVFKCHFYQKGDYNISIQYKLAHCKPQQNTSTPQNSYCLLNVHYTFTIRTVWGQTQHIILHIVLGVLSASCIVSIVIAFQWCQQQLTNREQIVEGLRRRRNKKTKPEQGSHQAIVVAPIEELNQA